MDILSIHNHGMAIRMIEHEDLCGNLSYSTASDDLRELFENYGEVASADVIMDRSSGRSGFGFVEMNDDAASRKAIESLNGSELQGRTITVNEAKPRETVPAPTIAAVMAAAAAVTAVDVDAINTAGLFPKIHQRPEQ